MGFGDKRERDLVLLGIGPLRNSSVGTSDVPGGVDVDEDTFVMVGRPVACGLNCGCCPPGTSSADRELGESWLC